MLCCVAFTVALCVVRGRTHRRCGCLPPKLLRCVCVVVGLQGVSGSRCALLHCAALRLLLRLRLPWWALCCLCCLAG